MLASFQSLSQELVDEIVSYLQEDKTSLLACSLTCRSLVPGCQRALFPNLCVGAPSAPSGRAIVTNVPTIHHFLKLMEMMPHVAAYTKTLKLTFDFLEDDLDERLVAQLASFRCLTHFSLHLTESSTNYLLMSSELKSSIQNILGLRTLEHLRLVDVPADILRYATSIKHLVVHFCDLESRVHGVHRAMRRFLEGSQPCMALPRSDEKSSTAIESLDFDHSELNIKLGINYVLDSPTLDLSKLKRLQIDIEDMETEDQHEHISRLLRACSSIQVLRLIPSRDTNALEEDGWPDDDPEIVDLSPLGSLRVLALRLHIFYFAHETLEHEIWTPFLWLLRSLATLPKSNSLEQITLHIVHVNSGEHPYLPIEHVQACILWEYFGPFLTKRFPYLRTVKLLLQAEVMPILRKIVDAEHPQAIELQERGLLKIEDWDAEVDSWDAHRAGFPEFRDSF